MFSILLPEKELYFYKCFTEMSDFIKVSELLNKQIKKQVIKDKKDDQPENNRTKIKEKIGQMVCHRYMRETRCEKNDACQCCH